MVNLLRKNKICSSFRFRENGGLQVKLALSITTTIFFNSDTWTGCDDFDVFSYERMKFVALFVFGKKTGTANFTPKAFLENEESDQF